MSFGTLLVRVRAVNQDFDSSAGVTESNRVCQLQMVRSLYVPQVLLLTSRVYSGHSFADAPTFS